MGELEGLQLGRGDQANPLLLSETWDILENVSQQLLRKGDVQRRLGGKTCLYGKNTHV